MKVLLVRPSWEYPITKEEATYNRVWMPLELLTTAALLKKDGHNVAILDAHALRITPQEVAQKAAKYDSIFVSSSSYDRWQCPNVNIAPVLTTIKEIQKINSNIYVLGYHGTVKPKEILELTKTKAVICGEPELTVKELCQHDDLTQIKGICYTKNNEIIITTERPLLEMDTLLPPAFHLINTKLYFYELLGENFALFEGSRGCPFSCNFCVLTMFKNKYRKKSSSKLISEVDDAIANHNIKNAYFMDLEFTINKQLANDLCDHLIEKNYDFNWCCQTRADSVDLPLLKKMKQAKCKLIHFGVESGSKEILKSTNKKITLETIEEGIKLTKKAKIKSMCFFLFGLPGETKSNIEQTIKFAKKLKPDYASFHIVLPYPGTKLHSTSIIPNEAENIEKGIFALDYERTVPLEQLQKLLKKAVMSYYLNPAYIIRALFNGTLTSPIKLMQIFIQRIKKL